MTKRKTKTEVDPLVAAADIAQKPESLSKKRFVVSVCNDSRLPCYFVSLVVPAPLMVRIVAMVEKDQATYVATMIGDDGRDCAFATFKKKEDVLPWVDKRLLVAEDSKDARFSGILKLYRHSTVEVPF